MKFKDLIEIVAGTIFVMAAFTIILFIVHYCFILYHEIKKALFKLLRIEP